VTFTAVIAELADLQVLHDRLQRVNQLRTAHFSGANRGSAQRVGAKVLASSYNEPLITSEWAWRFLNWLCKPG